MPQIVNKALTTAGLELPAALDRGQASSWLISIKGAAGGFSLTFQGWPKDDSGFTTSNGSQLAYRDLSTTTDSLGSAAITANGNYRVYSDNLNVTLVVSAGTATISATAYHG